MAGSALRDHARKAAFVQRLLAAGRELDDAAITALAEEMARGINQVWLADSRLETSLPRLSAVTSRDEPAARQKPAPQSGPGGAAPKAAPPTAADTAGEADFDPFAFSVIVVLKRKGRAVLMRELAAIDSAEHLHRIAAAQHLGVDRAITALPRLREAMVDAAEQRLADRRAAAS